MSVIVITGGTGKIGGVLVRHFIAAGHTVVATARDTARLEPLRAELGERMLGVALDLCDPECGRQLAAALDGLGLRPDGLVNNARNPAFLRLAEDGTVPRENFLGELTVDVVAPYELTMALATQPDSRLCSVVNIGSMYGVTAANLGLYDNPNHSALHYSVAKAALIHLTRELAVRLAPAIRVNCVSFGGVEGRVPPAFLERYARLCPQGRMLGDADLTGPVDFLLSPAASGVTGHNLSADGGWTVW